uniref:PCI domain-containing protein n=1 Tax=Corethron hystrix TaxID=216773 RepID=A0A7S1C045_9STRA|mmetsp:Transcript_8970/g.19831  ORF Transcript_8970/g.19831 Transcript_8970/m.19831 type:complete len:492 (+) Transcript_8970:179-1654(+)
MSPSESKTMEVDDQHPVDQSQDNNEEDISDLQSLFDRAEVLISPSARTAGSSDAYPEKVLRKILEDDGQNRVGAAALALKERVIYLLVRLLCTKSDSSTASSVVRLLTGGDPSTDALLAAMNRARAAKVIRASLDAIADAAPNDSGLYISVCRSIISWCVENKRSFLRQRVESKLAGILFATGDYENALDLIGKLLEELKRLDDKALLVEAHLVESRVLHALRNIGKSKSSLTSSRAAANAIYVAPSLQASIDSMSGILHTEEGDYNTAHSYFLEAFEQLDALGDREKCIPCLKYMMLCKILYSLGKALKLSAAGGVAAKATTGTTGDTTLDLSGMISARQAVKYGGTDVDAMVDVAKAASRRSLREFELSISKFSEQLSDDLLIRHHLGVLREQLLESNLIRIIEPYSCVEIDYVSGLIEMPVRVVEKKLSQMILDGKFMGILDQGRGQLIVYEEGEPDAAMGKGLEVISNMDKVVTSLFARSRALRSTG